MNASFILNLSPANQSLHLSRQAFDDSGDRINAEYDVINMGRKGHQVVGSFFYDNVSLEHSLLVK